MSSVILVNNPVKNTIDTIELDTVLSDDHPKESEGTESPVERGVDMTDHCRRKPDALELEAIVSDIRPQQGGIELARVAKARDVLTRLNRDGTLVTVVTGLETYENMQLRKLAFVRNARVGNALQFRASFKYVRVVDTLRVKVARAVKPTGRKTPEDPNSKEKKKTKSILKSGIDSLRARFGGS